MAQIADTNYSRTGVRAERVIPETYQSGISFYLFSILFSVPLICFAGALFSDLAFVKDPDIQWSNFSSWLLAFGIFFLGVVIVLNLLRYLITMRRRRQPVSWVFGIVVLAAFVAGMFDNFIHSHDGWTSVWPVGLTLSAVTLALLVVALVVKITSLTHSYLVDAS
ncbi:MAG: DUF2231 domain-containing protein [Aestuariivirga sp.]